jgi:hypothetical protein
MDQINQERWLVRSAKFASGEGRMIKPLLSATVLAVSTLTMAQSASAQSPWAQVGALNCALAPTVDLIVVAKQKMTCQFTPNAAGPIQNYTGAMTTVGVDLGALAGGTLAWAVFASTSGPPFAALDGTYVGGSADATVGVGAGANVLLGGSARNVSLQPLSLEGTAGLNVQLGVSSLELAAAP